MRHEPVVVDVRIPVNDKEQLGIFRSEAEGGFEAPAAG
jgi:hypothetical protein